MKSQNIKWIISLSAFIVLTLGLYLVFLNLDNKDGPLPTVNIGKQTWMGKNLDVEVFRNGDLIPHAASDKAWWDAFNGKQPAWCYYDKSNASGRQFGKLYNWYAVNDSRGLAPVGWRIPSQEDWETLIAVLGGMASASQMLKSDKDWLNSTGSTNASGFSALPGGYRLVPGDFRDKGGFGIWWTSTPISLLGVRIDDSIEGINFTLTIDGDGDGIGKDHKGNGFSVRCIKD